MDSARLIGFARVTDYARARAFYDGVLGLEFVHQDDFALVLKSGANMIRLSRSKGFTPEDSTVLGWEVSGIEGAVAELARKGVSFEKYPWVNDPKGLGIWTAPNGDKVAWFKDPDGNILSVSEHEELAGGSSARGRRPRMRSQEHDAEAGSRRPRRSPIGR